LNIYSKEIIVYQRKKTRFSRMMEKRQEEGWITVARRRGRENRHGKDKTDQKAQVTSFYFTNFPDEVQLQDLKTRFSRIGEVVDIFIPSKRNKLGKFFGFVRFKDVTDARTIEEHMRDTWFGTYKLWANVARFEKEGSNYSNFDGEKQRFYSNTNGAYSKQSKRDVAPEKHRSERQESIKKYGSEASKLNNEGRDSYKKKKLELRRSYRKEG
jgi:hypothetical protein